MAALLMIAHAATAATRRAAFGADGAPEPDALPAAQRLPLPRRVDLALCSPARAARDTAAAMGLAAAIEPALRDLDAGRWAGSAFADLAAAEPDAAARFLGDPAFSGHGGESLDGLAQRVGGWLDGFAGSRGHCVAVTHAAVIRAAVVAALGAPPAAFWRIDVAPLEAVALRCDGRRWSLRARPLG